MSGEEKSFGGGSRTLRHKERQRYLDDEGLTPTMDGAEDGKNEVVGERKLTGFLSIGIGRLGEVVSRISIEWGR